MQVAMRTLPRKVTCRVLRHVRRTGGATHGKQHGIGLGGHDRDEDGGAEDAAELHDSAARTGATTDLRHDRTCRNSAFRGGRMGLWQMGWSRLSERVGHSDDWTT